MIEEALRAMLVQSAPVAALVSGRVYPVVLPQAPEYPAVTYQMVTNDSEYSHGGPSRLATPRFQLDLYAQTFKGVITLRNAVMFAMSGTRGLFGSPPVRIQGVFRVMELDAYEQLLAPAGPRVWRKTLDFNLFFEEVYNG
jgi:hypothetical protein